MAALQSKLNRTQDERDGRGGGGEAGTAADTSTEARDTTWPAGAQPTSGPARPAPVRGMPALAHKKMSRPQ